MHGFFRKVGRIEDGFQIPLDAAYRRFQLMRDVLRELAFQARLLFLLGNVDDGYFERQVLEDDAFHRERAPVFVYVQGEPFFFLAEIPFVALQEFRNGL